MKKRKERKRRSEKLKRNGVRRVQKTRSGQEKGNWIKRERGIKLVKRAKKREKKKLVINLGGGG